jgi:hypothetical protein
MVNDFYFSSKKLVVFLLSNSEKGGKEVMWCGHINLSDRKRRERRSRHKGNLEGGGRGSEQKDVHSSHGTLIDTFEHIQNFFYPFEIYMAL